MLGADHIVPVSRESEGLAEWNTDGDGVDAAYDTQSLPCEGCALCDLGAGFCIQRVIYSPSDNGDPVVVHGMLGSA